MISWSKYLKYIQIGLVTISFISISVHSVLEWFHFYGWYGYLLLALHNGTLIVASGIIYFTLLKYIHITHGTVYHSFGVIDFGLLCDIIAYIYDFVINCVVHEFDPETTHIKIILISAGLLVNLVSNTLLVFHYVYGLNVFWAICTITSRTTSGTFGSKTYGSRFRSTSKRSSNTISSAD